MVHHLKDHFVFYIVCGDHDYCEHTPLDGIVVNTWNKRSENEYVYYSSLSTLNYKKVKKLILERNYHTVYLNGMFSPQFTLFPLLVRKFIRNKPKTVLAPRGMLSPSALKIKKNKKSIYLMLSRVLGLYNGLTFQATSLKEVNDIQHIFGNSRKVNQISNLPRYVNQASQYVPKKTVGSLSMISIARIAPEKNLMYALEVLKEYSFDGEICFNLYGSVYDESYWDGCKQLIKQLPDNIKIKYHGSFSSEKVGDLFSQNHLLFMPTLGENYGHVIAESLLFGRPVLISDQTPWKGLKEKRVGWDLSLKDKFGFAEAINTILAYDFQQFKKMCELCTIFANTEVVKSQDKQKYIDLFSV